MHTWGPRKRIAEYQTMIKMKRTQYRNKSEIVTHIEALSRFCFIVKRYRLNFLLSRRKWYFKKLIISDNAFMYNNVDYHIMASSEYFINTFYCMRVLFFRLNTPHGQLLTGLVHNFFICVLYIFNVLMWFWSFGCIYIVLSFGVIYVITIIIIITKHA